jgi:hypothetical protein
MKQIIKLVCILLLSALLLSAFQFPSSFASQSSTKPLKEQINLQLLSGFNAYVAEKGIRLDSNANTSKVFSNFLHSNPVYQQEFAEYTNLTLNELQNASPNPQQIQLSNSVTGPVFKTINETIYGKEYQIKFMNATAPDGTKFLKVAIGGTGTDPEIYLSIYPLVWNGIITYGEQDIFEINYPDGNDANWFRGYIDTYLTQATLLAGAIWTTCGIAIAAVGEPVLGAIVATYEGGITSANLQALKSAIDYANIYNGYIALKLVSTYIYPPYITPWSLPYFEIYAFIGNSWTLAYPVINSYLQDLTTGNIITPILMQEANALAFAAMVRQTANAYNNTYNQWIVLPSPPTPPPSPPTGGITMLIPVTVNSNSANGAQGVYLDDGSQIGNTGQTSNLTPEGHYISVDNDVSYQGRHYHFQDYEDYGSSITIYVETTEDTTLTANYNTIVNVNLDAVDESYYQLSVDVYIDGNYAGTTPFCAYVSPGYHDIEFNEDAWTWWSAHIFYSYGGPGYSDIEYESAFTAHYVLP